MSLHACTGKSLYTVIGGEKTNHAHVHPKRDARIKASCKNQSLHKTCKPRDFRNTGASVSAPQFFSRCMLVYLYSVAVGMFIWLSCFSWPSLLSLPSAQPSTSGWLPSVLQWWSHASRFAGAADRLPSGGSQHGR